MTSYLNLNYERTSMDIIYVLIGFICGYICREVLLQGQIRRAKQHFELFLKQQERKED